MDHRALKSYTLVGPPVFQPALAPLAVYSLTTDYKYYRGKFKQISQLFSGQHFLLFFLEDAKTNPIVVITIIRLGLSKIIFTTEAIIQVFIFE